jgi:hypothetical protein
MKASYHGCGSAFWISIIFWKLDPDPQSHNSEALAAQNRAVEAVDVHNIGLEARNEVLDGL